MENYNKLSSNLQQIVLDKLFKEQTNYYNELINQQIKNLSNDLKSICEDSFTPFILENSESNTYNQNILKSKHKFLNTSTHASTNYMIEQCDFCNNHGSITKFKNMPYYNSLLYEKKVYKSKKMYRKFYNMKFIEKSRLNYRCSWLTNFMCTSCYHGINKNISTQFYCSI
tara:strand:- start:722 stop:1231 length:510 start_codon:yes stop_codon:yes gene_type:complete